MKIRTLIFAIIFVIALLAVCVTASLFVIRCTAKPKATLYQEMNYTGAGLTPASYIKTEDNMDITNPPQEVPYVREISGKLIFCKLLQVPTWNMYATASKLVAHGLGTNFTKIISITGFIYNDANTVGLPILPTPVTIDTAYSSCRITSIDSTNINLARTPDTYFTLANWGSTANPRGWLLMWFYN